MCVCSRGQVKVRLNVVTTRGGEQATPRHAAPQKCRAPVRRLALFKTYLPRSYKKALFHRVSDSTEQVLPWFRLHVSMFTYT